MFAGLNFRTYAIIAVVTALVLYGLSFLFGSSIIGFLDQMKSDAISAGISSGIANVIVEPLKFALNSESIIGPAIAGVVWPLGAVWFVLLILMIVFAFVSPGVNSAADTIR